MQTPISILLVEDSPADVRLVTEALKDFTFSVNLCVVCDGVEALAFLRREGAYANAASPNLVLLDLNLPHTDGREVLAAIKSSQDLCQIPVIVLTSSMAERDVIESYRAGANCYVTKPLELDAFITAIRAIATFWLGTVRLPQK